MIYYGVIVQQEKVFSNKNIFDLNYMSFKQKLQQNLDYQVI